MSVTFAIVLDTRRAKKGKVYPIKLRVISERKAEYYPTIYNLSQESYNKLSAPRVSDELQKLRTVLREIERNATIFAQEIQPFNFSLFERDFVRPNSLFKERKQRTKAIPVVTVDSFEDFDFKPYKDTFKILDETHPDKYHISYTFTKYIKQLIEENRIGSALNYQDAYYCLKRFKGNVRFDIITVRFLNRFEQWMISENACTRTTVGIKLRHLRAVFNLAIADKIIRRDDCYPFGAKKYLIPTSRKIKKSLDLDDIKQLFEFEPERQEDQQAKAYWFFCYFGNGMNPKDLAYLKFKDLHGEYLHFIRAKTDRATRNDPKIITAYINEYMLRVIEKWGQDDRNPNNYIFPIIDKNSNPLQQHLRVKWLSKFIADGMKRICEQLGIDKLVNNAVCRHSFATITKRLGATTEYVQDALGHTTLTTTQIYLADYEDVVKKGFSTKLMEFGNDNIFSSKDEI